MSYEKIFEYHLTITGVTDYGADMASCGSGRGCPPASPRSVSRSNFVQRAHGRKMLVMQRPIKQ